LSYAAPTKTRQPKRVTETDLLKGRVKELEAKLARVIAETNNYVQLVQDHANTKLEELLQRQVEADGQVLDCWQSNVEELLAENEALRGENERRRAEVERLKGQVSKPKVEKRKGRKKKGVWEVEG